MTCETYSACVVCAHSDVKYSSGCGLHCDLRNEVVAVDDVCMSFVLDEGIAALVPFAVLESPRGV